MITLREFLEDDDKDGMMTRFREEKVEAAYGSALGLWGITFPGRAPPDAGSGSREARLLRSCVLMFWEMSREAGGPSPAEWRSMLGLEAGTGPAIPQD